MSGSSFRYKEGSILSDSAGDEPVIFIDDPESSQDAEDRESTLSFGKRVVEIQSGADGIDELSALGDGSNYPMDDLDLSESQPHQLNLASMLTLNRRNEQSPAFLNPAPPIQHMSEGASIAKVGCVPSIFPGWLRRAPMLLRVAISVAGVLVLISLVMLALVGSQGLQVGTSESTDNSLSAFANYSFPTPAPESSGSGNEKPNFFSPTTPPQVGSWTATPVNNPTMPPSHSASGAPTLIPSFAPSKIPSEVPSDVPSDGPSDIPTDTPSQGPSILPSTKPMVSPSGSPTKHPVHPTRAPIRLPTVSPTSKPTKTKKTEHPVRSPNLEPSIRPTARAVQHTTTPVVPLRTSSPTITPVARAPVSKAPVTPSPLDSSTTVHTPSPHSSPIAPVRVQ